ncbi:MMPL family transporter [Arthrobacter sp. zg-Y820]|uniref:MMPL family transporter n=1 Tax=unclassified Arthrobacter TaxID=235627 RepID=UPI001E4911A6|nr:MULTISPECIES: MMPL family transporter [unclassified Arthrobacter]MCC9197278.1 MMPL family transporter [Arthrobacter sp. zg-Y820]MDK1280143.1 MMPL family transporter [Arthrobacter sp. zg.Y820]WIB09435.1 MMPL family transporter [Arthrobacter sp. zg-Y820]
MAEFLYRLGRAAARRARTVLAVWIAVLAVAGIAFALFGGTLATAFSIPNTPTTQVTERLQEKLPQASGGSGSVIVQTEDGSRFTPEQQQEISALVTEAAEIDGVENVVDPFATEAERAAQGQQLAEGQAQIEAGRAQLEEARAQLDAGQEQLDAARAQAEAAGAPAEMLAGLETQQAELDAGRDELDTQAAELEAQAQPAEQGAELLEMAEGIRTVSEDGSAAVLNVVFSDTQMEITQETKDAVVAVFEDSRVDGVKVNYSAEISAAVPSLFGVGEVVGLVVAAVVLVVMLGSLIAAGLPLLTALIGVGIGALGALAFSGVVEMASITPILGLMLGLAVGIDYALFIVNRHRRQLKAGYALEESIALANGTSGNAVVFAGATVFIALLALNVTGIPFLGLMGTVGAACVAVAVLIAVTLTPALLKIAGRRVLSRKERAALDAHGAAATAAAGNGRPETAPVKAMGTGRAVLTVVAAIAGLLLIAIPALDLRQNLPDGSAEAHDSSQYQAYSAVSEKFGEGQNGSLLVVAELPGEPSEEEALTAQTEIARTLFDQEDVAAVAPIGSSEDRTVAAFQVIPTEGPTSESTETLVHTLRDMSPLNGEYEIGVAGSASGNIDISDKLSEALPIYLSVVVGLSLLILILVFRSIYVPVIATLGFILSYFAALGGVVAIYQWGWLSGVFGVETPGPILSFLPTILVGILFGLAMDYMLFLGSGMREAYAHGATARDAVAQGVRAGRSVVTAAAIIMAAVFGGFIFSHSTMIRPIGFALAFGVLLDAFVVRMLLIPALMHLAGDKAWWLPKWLNKILPDVDVEGASLERRHPHTDQPAVDGETGPAGTASKGTAPGDTVHDGAATR